MGTRHANFKVQCRRTFLHSNSTVEREEETGRKTRRWLVPNWLYNFEAEKKLTVAVRSCRLSISCTHVFKQMLQKKVNLHEVIRTETDREIITKSKTCSDMCMHPCFGVAFISSVQKKTFNKLFTCGNGVRSP